MAPRFMFNGFKQKRLSRKDFPPDGMPKEIKGEENRWTVYNQYKIVTPLSYEEAIKQVSSEELTGKLEEKLNIKLPGLVRLPKEKYISEEYISFSPASGISKIYNPFTDSPEVFLVFASLGKYDQPQRGKILEFVQSYGDILYSYIAGEVCIGTPIELFHREAKIAYNALRLYEEVIGLEKEKVKQRIDYILNSWHEINIINEGVDPYEACKDCEEPEGCLNCEYAPPSKIIKQMNDPIEAGSYLLTEIINRQIHDLTNHPITPLVLYRFEYVHGKLYPSFYTSWPVPTLLQAIWLLFFLKITGQVEQTYRICPFCEEPIIKPRKNQIYHDGCRQAKFNQDKRMVLKLWKEGKTAEEIAEETGLEIERIKKWTKGGLR